jgi:arylsulfatase A-like enzyme
LPSTNAGLLMNWRSAYLCCFGSVAANLFVFGTIGGAAGEPPPKLPNIVLIISDDQAWTDYSFMGHAHVRTPNIDLLASQGRTFKHGYVPSSLCCPSLASIITGLYPHQHRITCNDPPDVPHGANEAGRMRAFAEGREVMNRHLEAVPTLPRMLASAGYLSLQTGKWWQGDYRRLHPRDDTRHSAR